jgi:nucleoside-diphosphate-sugar epimerase
MKKETVLVTGGAGFIGAHLVERLLAEGYAVRVLDDVSSGSLENLRDANGGFDLLEGSILDMDVVMRAVQGVHAVFHEAAISTVGRSVNDPVRSNEANVTGTLNLLVASRDSGVERLMYASSSSVYGGIDALPVSEDLPAVPVSPYGVSKLAGELYCRSFTRVFGFPTVSLRYFNVFGPRQSPTSQYAAVIPRFALSLLSKTRPIIYGDGEQSRDFTYVDNVVHANLLALKAPTSAFGQTFNIAHGERHSLNDLLAEMGGIFGVSEVDVEWAAPRVGDVRHSQADISKAAESLGYRPLTTFSDGLRSTLTKLREQYESPTAGPIAGGAPRGA